MADSNENRKPHWLTTGQAATYMNVTSETVANWIKKGQLKAGSTPGGHFRVEADELIYFCNQQGFVVPIMIIDDDATIVSVLTTFLESTGHRVIGCSDVAEAGMMLMKEKPQLLILDLHLPGTHGMKIARMLRDEHELRNTRIFILSGFIDNSIIMSMKNLKIDRYLDKPPDLRVLSKAVEEVFNPLKPNKNKDTSN